MCDLKFGELKVGDRVLRGRRDNLTYMTKVRTVSTGRGKE